jgi:hypothetical protein
MVGATSGVDVPGLTDCSLGTASSSVGGVGGTLAMAVAERSSA